MITAVAVVLASLLLSDSFRHTIGRRKAVQDAKRELEQLVQSVQKRRDDIERLRLHPNGIENLVRKELGYLRPREKEARFVEK